MPQIDGHRVGSTPRTKRCGAAQYVGRVPVVAEDGNAGTSQVLQRALNLLDLFLASWLTELNFSKESFGHVFDGVQPQPGIFDAITQLDDLSVRPLVAGEWKARHRVNERRRVEVQQNRSEEHTSELQSLRHLVCRLL